jgi:hypothetical protein
MDTLQEKAQTMSQHTPGPWNTNYASDGLTVYHGTMPICTMSYGHGDYDLSYANARLIAAAPAMLAALKELREFIRDGNVCVTPCSDKAREDADCDRFAQLLDNSDAAIAAAALPLGRWLH